MGNQMENALKDAGIEHGKDLGETVADALDSLEQQLDDLSSSEDNKANVAEDASVQEEPTASVEELRSLIEDQNQTIDRLMGIMGKMVTRFGAQVSDGEGENVNTNLGGDDSNEVPLLSEIRLG